MLVGFDRKAFWENLILSLEEAGADGYIHVMSYRKNTDLRANTYYFHQKELFDLNVKWEYVDVKNGMCDVISLIAKYHPNLVIDLHEGKGKEAYMYVNSKDYEIISAAEHVIDCWKQEGIQVRKSAEDRIRILDGIYALEHLNALIVSWIWRRYFVCETFCFFRTWKR